MIINFLIIIQEVMKKRMIAWLLCACMTFTAAPEMLLADVAAKGQQTQEDENRPGQDRLRRNRQVRGRRSEF